MRKIPMVTIPLLIVLAFFCSMILAGCKSSRHKESDSLSLEDKVRNKLGDNTSIEMNSTNTFALAQQIQEPSRIGEPISYLVIRLPDKKIVYEGTFNRGYVKWISDDTIEVLNLPGKVQWSEDVSKYVKRINVRMPAREDK